MPGETFKIDTYGVSHDRFGSEPVASLSLYGRLGGGEPRGAYLTFRPWVTGFSGTTQQGRSFVLLPEEDFTLMYDLLRHEAPVYVKYRYAGEPTAEPTDLYQFSLEVNNTERPGEGPTDSSPV